MCELLNRIWSRPRGEWTRVLRRELPALAAEIVEELLHGIPEFSELIDDNDAVDEELLRQKVEEALLNALGYREPAGQTPASAPAPAPSEAPPAAVTRASSAAGYEERHDGRHEARREDMREAVRDSVRESLPDPERDPVRESPPGDGPRGGQGERPEDAGPPGARQELFRALTDDRAPSDASLTQLAEAAGWPLPPAVRAVALAAPGETHQLATALATALPGVFAGRPCLLVPSPDPDTRALLELPLRGRSAAVGHAVPLRDTASSLRWALRLLALTPTRAGLDARAVFVDDHLSTLLLLQDEPLAHALAARWLRPLADLTPRQSERLEVTLLAWLEGGGAPEAAKALNVHPQTVRYRMRQLEKLFGPGLRDPRTRFELEMALRSRRLMAQVRRQNARAGRRTARVVTADFTPLVVGRMARVNGL
ncbi:PucR family transcriptional regulator [Streptomyces sp. NPDC058646]|uniref:PucR family transcriptional regulator n=1 Tax=Streptomyces sp. NPDC058646 TaxID=3346574 RepID=UPI0036513A04